MCQILPKKWEYNGTVDHTVIGLKITYDSIWRKVLFSILTKFSIPVKLVRLLEMYLNKKPII